MNNQELKGSHNNSQIDTFSLVEIFIKTPSVGLANPLSILLISVRSIPASRASLSWGIPNSFLMRFIFSLRNA